MKQQKENFPKMEIGHFCYSVYLSNFFINFLDRNGTKNGQKLFRDLAFWYIKLFDFTAFLFYLNCIGKNAFQFQRKTLNWSYLRKLLKLLMIRKCEEWYFRKHWWRFKCGDWSKHWFFPFNFVFGSFGFELVWNILF